MPSQRGEGGQPDDRRRQSTRQARSWTMKKAMLSALVAATVLTPLAATPAAAFARGDPHDRYARNARYDRNDRREDRREVRRGARHNGFWANGRFYRGAPSAAQARARDFRYEQRQWRRGERLSAWDRAHYARVTDYRRYRLAPPPRGYEYRRSNTGEIILAAVATGIILNVLLNN
ncbi:MAG: hypothetical protein GC206_08255 [Alphaproteobacteria bacterium]|nr:hypothetical protein [Alphaproteobacteria bacterium]